jgi:hypothetical protein
LATWSRSNGDVVVVGVELGSATWWRGFHGLRRFDCLGLGLGRGSVVGAGSLISLPRSLHLGSAPWWRGFHGYARSVVGAGFPSLISHLSPSIFISQQREKKNKLGVLFVRNFLASSLCVNFLLVGKQCLLSATAELKLYSFTSHYYTLLGIIPSGPAHVESYKPTLAHASERFWTPRP